jgi:hypothetical protein
MERIHPLASDHDAKTEEVGASEATCAMLLGRLDGLLSGLTDPEKRLFCWYFLRTSLLSALTRSGYADAEHRFDAWFTGAGRGPEETPRTSLSARSIVRAILADLSHHGWEPLAETARLAGRIGRFRSDRDDVQDQADAAQALQAAHGLAGRAVRSSAGPLPFPALGQLVELARQDPRFAPANRETRAIAVGGRIVSYEQDAAHGAIWALDFAWGEVASSCAAWHIPLPCPGASGPYLLAPHLWPGERRLAICESTAKTVSELIRMAETSRRHVRALAAALSGLRSSSRAPDVWMAILGFAPFGIDQIADAFGMSRRGVYTVTETLASAGLLRRTTERGLVVFSGVEPEPIPAASAPVGVDALPSPALAAFDAAMSEIDRLLSRQSERGL